MAQVIQTPTVFRQPTPSTLGLWSKNVMAPLLTSLTNTMLQQQIWKERHGEMKKEREEAEYRSMVSEGWQPYTGMEERFAPRPSGESVTVSGKRLFPPKIEIMTTQGGGRVLKYGNKVQFISPQKTDITDFDKKWFLYKNKTLTEDEFLYSIKAKPTPKGYKPGVMEEIKTGSQKPYIWGDPIPEGWKVISSAESPASKLSRAKELAETKSELTFERQKRITTLRHDLEKERIRLRADISKTKNTAELNAKKQRYRQNLIRNYGPPTNLLGQVQHLKPKAKLDMISGWLNAKKQEKEYGALTDRELDMIQQNIFSQHQIPIEIQHAISAMEMAGASAGEIYAVLAKRLGIITNANP